ncbi:hypothetical protein B0H16DRAFT_1737048 [Mycena metata]|uniref:Uncharacterized protein n=1 Tax=Mycena metata TaxID=1033252 RepID=A0AAD7HM62_9AGAR|nr:hypothetical protein B0H16DRAFT_1737048 [Mycena metata]
MSSRHSTPIDSDDDMVAAMAQETPTILRAKRGHAAMGAADITGSNDDDDVAGRSLPVAITLPNQNLVATVRHYGERKRLRTEQLTELEVAARDPPQLRELKLMANMFAFSNQLEQIIVSKPGFELSADLKLNIQKYAPAILYSDRLNTYKGEVPTSMLLEVIKKLRFGLAAGLENIPADWAKVEQCAEYSLTQTRSKTKKCVRASLNPTKDKNTTVVTYGEESGHQNIFELTTAIVKGTQCSVNIRLCSRVAIMRQVYLKHPNGNFSDQVDKKLEKIRTTANGDQKQIAKHGKKSYKDSDIEEKVNEFQQKVDDIMDIGVMDAATSTQDHPGAA